MIKNLTVLCLFIVLFNGVNAKSKKNNPHHAQTNPPTHTETFPPAVPVSDSSKKSGPSSTEASKTIIVVEAPSTSADHDRTSQRPATPAVTDKSPVTNQPSTNKVQGSSIVPETNKPTVLETNKPTVVPAQSSSNLPPSAAPKTQGSTDRSSSKPETNKPTVVPAQGSSNLPSSAAPKTQGSTDRSSDKPVTTTQKVVIFSSPLPSTQAPSYEYVLTGVVLCEQKVNAWLEVGVDVEAVAEAGQVYANNQTNSYGQFKISIHNQQLSSPSIHLQVKSKNCPDAKLDARAVLDLSGKQLNYHFGPLLLSQ